MNPSHSIVAATIALAAFTACTKKTETPPVPKTAPAASAAFGSVPAG